MIQNTKFFNIILISLNFFYFYKFYFLLFKLQIIYYLNFQILFLIPKCCVIFIYIYKKNFLFFYIVDTFLSALFFLYLVNVSLDILFPIIGVVYNKTIFEETVS